MVDRDKVREMEMYFSSFEAETVSEVSSVFSGNVAWQGFNNYLFPGKVVNSLFGIAYGEKRETITYIAE